VFCNQETLWKKLQRSLGLERHSTTSPLSHSSQPDLQQTPLTRRFLLETSSPLADDLASRSRDPPLTMTSRCRSLPGRMHDSGSGGSGQGGVDGWDRPSTSYKATAARARRTDAASVPLRTRRSQYLHHHQQHQQQHGRHNSSPTYVTPSSHLTLPASHRSRATVKPHDRRASPSRFSWPGASFDLHDDEGRSSGGTQGAAEPTSPSLPSSTSTATNHPPQQQRCDVTAPTDDVTPSNGEVGDVTTTTAGNGDVITSGADPESSSVGLRRRRSCEFNLLDDDDDSWSADVRGAGPAEWAWSSSSRSDWADVICINDDSETTTTATGDDVIETRGDVTTQTPAINETVMKCIESCDKVLLRHSTAIR